MPHGYTRTASGFRAWVRVTSRPDQFNALRTKRFPATTTVDEIRAWRADARARLRTQLTAHQQRRAALFGTTGTLRADAVRYLEAVRAMPTFHERAREIALWIAEFGDRPRASIQSHEIRAVRDRWLTSGPRRRWRRVHGIGQWVDCAEPLAASTVNHRLRALRNLWTVLDGRHAPNPVRDVPEVQEPDAIPRAIDYDTIRQILAAMADRGRPTKGHPRPKESMAKAGARVLAWTGLTAGELLRMLKDDLDAYVNWQDQILTVPRRRKGRGAAARLVPLSPDALAALRDVRRLHAGGARFDKGAALRAWQRACRQVLGHSLRLHDIRHSFITGIVRATHNLQTAQLLAGHQDPRTTHRYALAAVLPTLRASVEAFTQSVTPKESTDETHVFPETPRSSR